jgi:hypothetical protein
VLSAIGKDNGETAWDGPNGQWKTRIRHAARIRQRF